MNECVPGVEHLQLKGERLIWGGDFDYLKKFVKEGLRQRGKWSSPGGTTKAFKSRDTKLTLTWYRGNNQTLSLQGKDSPVLKAKLINLVRSKDPSSAQFDSSLLPESTEASPVEFEAEIVTKEVGVQIDLPPDFVMGDNTENVLGEGLRLSVISKSPPSLVEANNGNIYQGRPRGAGGQRNSDHPPNSEIVADLEGVKLDFLILQKQVEANSRSL